MNNVKTKFNIRDLENLSGIKAHTIRIWEKRYNILEPMRTETNIRFYDIENLQKLLNITTLHNFGYKISAISKMPEEKLPVLVKEILSNKSMSNHILNDFKLAMMNFDQALFLNTYNALLQEKSFREIFYDFFIPLLNEIGLLWQTNTITPAHEHFISFLIKQKLASNIEKLLLQPPQKTERTYILYLPKNEIHELGLMFINYELALNDHKSIFLGESVPIDSLKDVKKHFDNVTFVTYITVEPTMGEINDYIEELKLELINDDTTLLYVFGHNTQFINEDKINKNISVFKSISEFSNGL
ncbi:MerR family transcriptional regulator [Flavobacterium arcticum]|uniref:MerR family transcriptional regulator n=1 Tax=Flavobacterium arcticum TaxID=1784713 RepID=A0A345HEU2_9FLAO|nr:MerR family transcriptional regulator [Flavobacterium arcticum]AXG75102.1 MerR family transcriptional regulator [Flavobacterium arcticum]KAF2511118.1 MerR family transcriptional regulator [Flavobacterium arcticum]